MMLPDDDELYEVDQTYLGPPGRYLGALRFKAIAAWLAIGPLALVVLHKLGVPMTVLTVGLTVLGVTALSGVIADIATPERPLVSVVRTFINDLRARRASTAAHGSSASRHPGRVRPGGQLGKWVHRNQKPTT